MNKQLLKQTLITQAFADAFGYWIEFEHSSNIINLYGQSGLMINYALDLVSQNKKRLLITDDTQMSLFALEGLTNCIDNGKFHYDQRTITQSFLNWYGTQETSNKHDTSSPLFIQPFLHYRRAPGNTCLSSLKKLDTSINLLYDTNSLPNQSKGCGGIMRALPFSFFAQNDIEAFNYSREQAAITHGHICGYDSAGLYGLICFYLLHKTSDISHAYQLAYRFYTEHFGHTSLTDYLNKLNNCINLFHQGKIFTSKELNSYLGEGWTGDESLIISIYCSIVGHSLEHVIEYSANHDGDSDSTAMLSAGLYQLANPTKNIHYLTQHLQEFNDLDKSIDLLLSKI